MISKEERDNVPIDILTITKVIKESGYPVYQSIVDFQRNYAGITYQLGDSIEGFSLVMIEAIDSQLKTEKYELADEPFELNGEYYFTCAYYHYNQSYYMVMDSTGRVCSKDYGYGKPFPIADSIEKFIEKDAVKNYFLEKQSQWVLAAFKSEKLDNWLNDASIGLEKITEACDSYTTYWKSKGEDIFIEIQSYEDGEDDNRLVYAVSLDVISNLFHNDIEVAVGYPKYTIYKFTKGGNS